MGTCVYAQNYSKVKIYTDQAGLQQLAELGLAVDHGVRKENTFFIGDFSQQDLEVLANSAFEYEVVVEDVKAYYASINLMSAKKNVICDPAVSGGTPLPETPVNFEVNSSYAGFYKYQDMLDALDSMAAQYPNLITARSAIPTGQTHEGRDVFYVKISDNASMTDDASEPNVLYTAIHHAREPMSMSETIFYMWYLLENYASDPEIQYIVDNTEMYFVPCINPDGYIHNEVNDPNGFGSHRKNKAPVGTSNPGVDLNRNYSYGWNTTGVSGNPNQDTYPGSGPFSEPETQAMKWMVETYHFKTGMNAHSYGMQMLFPIGTTSAEFADHHDYFQDLSNHMVKFNGYEAIKSSGLYPASGDSDDYMYKDSIGVNGKDTMFVMTPETGSDFWPPQNEVIPTCAAMVWSNLRMAHVTHRYLTTDDTDDAIIGTPTGFFHHKVQRLGFESGPVTVFINPITNIQSVGTGVTYDINWHTVDNDSISYTLNPTIQFGDEVVYELITDYGDWQYRDTISKTYDQWLVVVNDDASSTANWTGTWELTTDAAYSPTTSFTESDGGDYDDDDNKTYTYNTAIDLTNANNAMVTFYAKWSIESNYDYCQFQVSTDNGASWDGQCGLYTVEGSSTPWNGSVQPDGEPVWEATSDWVQEEISLSDYIGQSVQLRFQFESDGGVSQDGFYFDDFQVLIDAPAALEELNGLQLVAAPNPANESLIISAANTFSGTLMLFDQAGKVVYEHEIDGEQKQVEVPTAQLPEGIYVARIANRFSVKPVKVVVMH
ncbi:MAG: hypothetical protein Crog3KO_08110 [Crocinitomicaceae bacterium]